MVREMEIDSLLRYHAALELPGDEISVQLAREVLHVVHRGVLSQNLMKIQSQLRGKRIVPQNLNLSYTDRWTQPTVTPGHSSA